MKRSLVLKLLPVTLMAAIGLFLAAKAPPQANAAVSVLSPSSFVVNAGSPVSFSFTAQAGAGAVSISASSAASTFINVTSCGGCAPSGNGTSSVAFNTPAGTSNFSVTFTLDTACTTSGLPINVVVSQGTSSAASGVTGTCSCNYSVYGNCGCAAYSTLGCGCGTYAYSTVACGCGTYAYTTAACGCGTYAYSTAACGCGTYASSNCCPTYGTTQPVYVNGVLVTNGAYGTGVYGANVYGNTNVYGNNCGVCTTTGLLANCAVGTSQVSVTVPGSAVCGSRINVLVTVRNSIGGIAIDGTQVALTSNMGALTPTTTVTSGGIASSSILLAPTGAGTATVTASSNGVSGAASINVTCTAAPAPVVVAPAPVPPVVFQPIISAPNAGDGGCLAKGGCN
jgi:hypothetical protein